MIIKMKVDFVTPLFKKVLLILLKLVAIYQLMYRGAENVRSGDLGGNFVHLGKFYKKNIQSILILM